MDDEIISKKLKMIPLKTHKRVFTWCCLCPAAENAKSWQKLAYIIFGSVIFGGLLSIVFMSLIFVIKFVSVDLEGSLHSLFELIGFARLAYAMMTEFFLRNKIASIFDQLRKIYSKYSKNDSYEFLIRANTKSEWMWKIYSKFIGSVLLASTLIASFSVLSCWLQNGVFDSESLYHPFKLILPWNIATPAGYFGEILYHIITAQAYLLNNGMTLLLFVAICLHHQAFYQMFEFSVRSFGKHRRPKELIHELIEFHCTIKSWMVQTVDVYSSFILVQLTCMTVSLACIIFQLDLQFRHVGSEVAYLFMAFVIVAANPFVYCFFGLKATQCYGNLADVIFKNDWHLLPPEVQKNLVLIIGNTQIPLYYHGFGVAILNLETFFKILRANFTYYMMFKTITAD